MSDEIKSLSEEVKRTHEEFKGVLQDRQTEIAKLGTDSAETKAKLDKMEAAFIAAADKQKEVEQKLARAERAEAASERESKDAREAKAMKSWRDYATSDTWNKKNVELKVLVEGDLTGAGVFALPQRLNEVLKGVIETSPFRTYARVISTSNLSVQIPKRTGVFAAVWVGEQTTRSETTGLTYGMEEVPTHEMQAMVDISNWMLEDSSFDLEGQIGTEASEQFGVAEGAAFLSGSGTKKPEGIITNGAVSTTTVQSSNDLTDWTKLVDIQAAVKTRYLAGSAYYMNRTSIGKVRKMIDGASRPIFEPAAGTVTGAARGWTLFGFPVVECPDMDSPGSGKKPVIFGDMARGYLVVDRTSVISVRDPFTQQGSGNVRFWFRRRVGGQVAIAEALRIGT